MTLYIIGAFFMYGFLIVMEPKGFKENFIAIISCIIWPYMAGALLCKILKESGIEFLQDDDKT